jgi:outer membrane protein assembly factor BamB
MSTESAIAPKLSGLVPGRIACAFIVAALIVVVVVRLMGLVDVPWPLDDPAVRNILTLIFAFIAVATAWVWFVFVSGYSTRARRWTFIGTLAAVAIAVGTLRLVEVTGSMVPSFAVRWGWRPPDHTLGRWEGSVAVPIDLTTTTADDFPQFLGPERSCMAPGPPLARDWSEQPPKLIWKQPIGAGWSAFSAVNGYAVTMEQRGPEEWITCYEIATGKPVWGHAIEARHENPMGGVGPRGTPTIYKGRVYALGATGVLRCLDGATGKLRWSDDLRKRYRVDGRASFAGTPLDEVLVQWGRAASPLIVEKDRNATEGVPYSALVIVPGGGPAGEAKNLVAFDAESGKVAWESQNIKEDGKADQIAYASPALATVAGRRQILIVNESTASGHEPSTGERLWSFSWPGGSSSMASASNAVAIDENRVLLTKGYGGGAELIAIAPPASGNELSVTSVWKAPYLLQTKFSNVVVHRGYAYGLSEEILQCVDVAVGKRKWKGGRFGHGQILGVGDLLLVLSETGELNLVELTPNKSSALASMPVLEGKTWNNLCLYGRLLLVRNGQEAACYEMPLSAR